MKYFLLALFSIGMVIGIVLMTTPEETTVLETSVVLSKVVLSTEEIVTAGEPIPQIIPEVVSPTLCATEAFTPLLPEEIFCWYPAETALFCANTTRTYCDTESGTVYTCCTADGERKYTACKDGQKIDSGYSWSAVPEHCYPNGDTCERK